MTPLRVLYSHFWLFKPRGEIKSPDEIMLIEIKSGSCLPWSFDSPNQIRRSGEISQLTKKDQGSIPHLAERIKGLALYAIPNFAEAVSSLAARLLFRYKTDRLNLFLNFQGDYTPLSPINSLPEAHKEKKRHEERGETGEDREKIRDLLSYFQEFRELPL